MTSFSPIKTLGYGWKIIEGTIIIPSTSVGGGSPIVSGVLQYHEGIRSGTASSIAGVYTASLGDSGSVSSISNSRYDYLVGSIFSVQPVASASSYSPPNTTVRLIADNVRQNGTIVFATHTLSASATAGTITETVARPARDTKVGITLFVKGKL